jgi:hypothetical protein
LFKTFEIARREAAGASIQQGGHGIERLAAEEIPPDKGIVSPVAGRSARLFRQAG